MGLISASGAGLSQHNSQANKVLPTKKPEEAFETAIQKQSGTKNPAQLGGANKVASQTIDTSSAQQTAPATPISRSVSPQDVIQQLLQMNISATPLNKSIATLMMQYGVELSQDNFEQIFKRLRGKSDGSDLEAAVISLSKGVSDSQASVDFLGKFLAKMKSNSQVHQKFQQALQKFQGFLNGTNGLPEGVSERLSALMSELNEDLKKLLKKGKKGFPEIKRGEKIRNLYDLHQLLDGLARKLASSDASAVYALKKMQSALKEMLGDFTAQIILSKQSEKQPAGVMEDFAYWQIPNVMAQKPTESMIDLLIRKDPNKKEVSIDPAKAKVMLQFETPELGEVTLTLSTMGEKVWYTFNTEFESASKLINSSQKDLLERMDSIGYVMAGFQTVRKAVDIKRHLLPTQSLDDVIRISAEV